MGRLSEVVVLVIVFIVVVGTSTTTSRRPPHYTIDLDVAPEKRWTQIIRDHVDVIPGIVAEAKKFVPSFAQPFVWWFAGNIARFFDDDYRKELEGMAAEAGLPLGEVVGLNILYDISAFDRRHVFGLGCTSIVLQTDDGGILHGRNLDYEMGDLLKNLTVFVDFTRGGAVIYSGVTFALYNGLLTGQRPNAFSVSLNARYSGPYIENVLMELYTRFRRPVSYFIREVLTAKTTFDEAVTALSSEHLISPSYIVVGGLRNDEGVVISRNRWKAADVYRLGDGGWYLVETNFDHWSGDTDPRRLKAIELLKKIGPEAIDVALLQNILSTSPVRNNLTIFSTVFAAANPQYLADTLVVWE